MITPVNLDKVIYAEIDYDLFDRLVCAYILNLPQGVFWYSCCQFEWSNDTVERFCNLRAPDMYETSCLERFKQGTIVGEDYTPPNDCSISGHILACELRRLGLFDCNNLLVVLSW